MSLYTQDFKTPWLSNISLPSVQAGPTRLTCGTPPPISANQTIFMIIIIKLIAHGESSLHKCMLWSTTTHYLTLCAGCTTQIGLPILLHANIWYKKHHFFILQALKCSQNTNFLQENNIFHQIKGIWGRQERLDFSLWWYKVGCPLNGHSLSQNHISRCRIGKN